MVFSSLVFLFLFLPVVLGTYYVAPGKLRNVVLLLASLWFYYWGEAAFLALMLASVVVNYLFGLWIGRVAQTNSKNALFMVTGAAVILNLLPLLYFKYTAFLVDNIREVLGTGFLHQLSPSDIHLPIGVSFFTFQAISYVVDVSRQSIKPQRNPIDFGMYLSMFPQLVAGPIVRYAEIEQQIRNRITRFDDVAEGVYRFLIGFVKKVLIANTMGEYADHVFSVDANELSVGVAWLGLAAYTFQIYFDFSGYSDMAIGLGRIFGFKFPENFKHPYAARSITDFWRRWHITLSQWFRDYVYIPLGGNRGGGVRLYRNLLIVFVLCGLWHGANWTFAIWGLFHGSLLVMERFFNSNRATKIPSILLHLYVCIAVMVGWVFFRADSVGHAFSYLNALVGFGREPYLDVFVFTFSDREFWAMFFLAIVFSMPTRAFFQNKFSALISKPRTSLMLGTPVALVSSAALAMLALYGVSSLIASGYNPFIYFRF